MAMSTSSNVLSRPKSSGSKLPKTGRSWVRHQMILVGTSSSNKISGKYRNPWTDLVEFADRTTANTTALPYKGLILALKEDSWPYALDPRTLETIGRFDFDGQLESETFTAHPKYDVKTRELLAFGYEGKGIGSRDVFYMSIDEHGEFTERVWFEAPYCGFQHDMAFTDNWVCPCDLSFARKIYADIFRSCSRLCPWYDSFKVFRRLHELLLLPAL